jgi:hypothetical protein
MIDLEKTLKIGEAWRQAEKLPPRKDNTDNALLMIAVLFFAQAAPLFVALFFSGGC